MTPEMRARAELAQKKNQFLADQGAALLIDPSTRGDGGTLFVQSASVPGASPFPMPGQGQGARRTSSWDKNAPKLTPQIVMAQEHYNRLVRMIQQGERPKMVVDLSVQFHDDDVVPAVLRAWQAVLQKTVPRQTPDQEINLLVDLLPAGCKRGEW